ncbi:MAG: transglutaminase family protein [Saccharofermentans sp.]|nr:transglutaminase family protein [Saccharofermentans sp.]
MKKLHFDYSMRIDYEEMVSTCSFTIKCIPQKNNRQVPDNVHIDICPPTKYCLGLDGLNNPQIYGKNGYPHDYFTYRITGDVVVGLSLYDDLAEPGLAMIFNHPHGLNIPGENIKKYYDSLDVDGIDDPYQKAMRIMYRFHDDYEYMTNSTNIYTTAEEAFSQGHGVCQDFAHIFIALMHLAGIPARYVTGLIVGEGASHAWVEVLSDGKWYGLDPTNNKPVFDEHIKLGVGRDANDCMINRGIMHGGGLQTQTINVLVEEIDERKMEND